MKTNLILAAALAAATSTFAAPARPQWPIEKLFRTPKTFDSSAYATNSVKTVFYEGLPYKGKPTRVFAYYGVPDHKPGEKVPGIVLVHGGGGSAFVRWVKLWNARGYAAISMDTCGCIPGNVFGSEQRGHRRHEHGGPAGWGGYAQLSDPVEDQWMYHAVADVILAHSFLRSLPDVDPARIGITGISWGGTLTCIVAGVDDRFAFGVPVYGCGFLFKPYSSWTANCKSPKEFKLRSAWADLWDPSRWLVDARFPLLWVVGTNDSHFSPPSVKNSMALVKGPNALAMRVRMHHAHGPAGENPGEILAFADQWTRGAAPMPEIRSVSRDGNRATVRYSADPRRLPVKAVLNYTRDGGDVWMKRLWESAPASLDAAKSCASADLPDGVKAWYINLVTTDGLVASSKFEE